MSSFKTITIVSLSLLFSAGLLSYYIKFNDEIEDDVHQVDNSLLSIKETNGENVVFNEVESISEEEVDETSNEKLYLDNPINDEVGNDAEAVLKSTSKDNITENVPYQNVDREISEDKIKDLCASVRISTKIEINPTCVGEKNGALLVDVDKTTGGRSPYFYSLDGENYSLKGEFNDLSKGSYSFYIEDADGCVIKIDNYIQVNSKVCRSK